MLSAKNRTTQWKNKIKLLSKNFSRGKHRYREWNLAQTVEAQAMFIKCFWNILWWVIDVVNCIKSTEHKSNSFQAPVWAFSHYNSLQASPRLPSIWLINSTLVTSVSHMIQLLCFLWKHHISSQLLMVYTCICFVFLFLVQILVAFRNQLLPGY